MSLLKKLQARRAARRAQRGMTLLEIMIVLAILALVMGLVVGPRVMKMFAKSKVDIAKAEMRKLAFEAYPQWSSSNPSKGCPERIEELGEFADKKDMKDPWGTPYKMFCGANLPPGAKSLAITSAGEDAKEGTSDDLKSWDE